MTSIKSDLSKNLRSDLNKNLRRIISEEGIITAEKDDTLAWVINDPGDTTNVLFYYCCHTGKSIFISVHWSWTLVTLSSPSCSSMMP